MPSNKKVLILGGSGLVGSSLVRVFQAEGVPLLNPKRNELDLLNQQDVGEYIGTHLPDLIILTAAKVGGILANQTRPLDFILQNLTIQNNVFSAAISSRVENFIFLGSSCIYPKNCPQPIKEEYLLESALESTNEFYAIAKIAGLKTAQAVGRQEGFSYVSLMPSNLYGPGDNYSAQMSHVIPGLIQRLNQSIGNNKDHFEAWGSGEPLREFLYVDDLAKACLFLYKKGLKGLKDIINIGSGEEIRIRDLVSKIATEMGFKGKINFNKSYPDGTSRKILDSSYINNLGWKAQTSFDSGLKATLEDYNRRISSK